MEHKNGIKYADYEADLVSLELTGKFNRSVEEIEQEAFERRYHELLTWVQNKDQLAQSLASKKFDLETQMKTMSAPKGKQREALQKRIEANNKSLKDAQRLFQKHTNGLVKLISENLDRVYDMFAHDVELMQTAIAYVIMNDPEKKYRAAINAWQVSKDWISKEVISRPDPTAAAAAGKDLPGTTGENANN